MKLSWLLALCVPNLIVAQQEPEGQGAEPVDPVAAMKELFAENEGSHATCSEISLTYYADPDHVKQAEMSPPRVPTGPILDADDYGRRFPDGRIGSNPSLASVEAGRRLHDAAVKDLSDEWTAFAA